MQIQQYISSVYCNVFTCMKTGRPSCLDEDGSVVVAALQCVLVWNAASAA